jgi:hypothetical protein
MRREFEVLALALWWPDAPLKRRENFWQGPIRLREDASARHGPL